MTEPQVEPAPDPASVSTEDELRAAVLALLGDSYDRAVERRTGLSKTTVNDVRNERRRLTAKTLTLIVEAYDPQRRDVWLAAWRRVRVSSERAGASLAADDDAQPAEPGHGLAGTDPGADADAPGSPFPSAGAHLAGGAGGVPATDGAWDVAATGRRARSGRDAGSGPWRTVSVTVGIALAAGASAALITYFATRGDAVGPTAPVPTNTATAGGPGLVLPGQAPPLGPGGPGAAWPVGGIGPPRFDQSPAARGPAPVARGCYTLPLQSSADVVTEPGADAAGVRLTELRYTYYSAWHPALAFGGRLSGPVPRSSRLVFAAWADPSTTDSTRDHNRGNGRFYPGDDLATTDQNCFTIPPYNLSYGGYPGITTRLYAMLVDTTGLTQFMHTAGQSAGLTDTDLSRLGIRILGYAVVPSKPE
ncbi:XRE family transcriptional regulator [Frankia sp. AgB1.9]|uniref:XRE family transcriptional regulator n=1 Tax=unclassified Frankia TaxID=2632575 RepID=UPI0019332C15|nr:MULTISPECIES: XRE family transcriptional regulator [unclassified Frankia]MBL7492048.1 XRE family transcriptional regulator [Frankia sp. AgW1.1]MBL7551170.1 XRE family transcriptional regulator [Frankia sp. AgB1.9]MBL7617808.1 XRE family transcriptional regulator [Frankia sp. AgB1.8]